MSDQRIVIVFDGEAWFVRHIRVIEHDLDRDEKVYRCDRPIGTSYLTLGKVPLVEAEVRKRERLARLYEAQWWAARTPTSFIGPEKQERLAALGNQDPQPAVLESEQPK